MWMVNDGADHLNNGRKLCPLIPRPSTNNTTTSPNNNPSPYLTAFNGTDFLTFNHLGNSGIEQIKRELNTQQVVVSSRWNPTPEQLQILEELYRRGTRTPTTDHIQHITAQLRRYGKIEGKNVFYWFQNHKARERQKRRRQLESPHSDQQHIQDVQENFERRELGANRSGIEVEQTKNWVPTANSSTFAEKSGRSGRGERRAENIGWKQMEEEEGEPMMNQRTRNGINSDKNATWHMMKYLSCSPTMLPPTTAANNLLLNSNTTTTNSTTMPTLTKRRTILDQNLIKPQHLTTIFTRSHYQNPNDQNLNQTLELFPLRSGTGNNITDQNVSQKQAGGKLTVDAINTTTFDHNFTSAAAPCQFFEFLPLKN